MTVRGRTTKGGKVPNLGGEFQIRGQVGGGGGGAIGPGSGRPCDRPGAVARFGGGRRSYFSVAQVVAFQERWSSWRAAVAWAW